MTYKIVKEPRAWWPVVWNGVTEEGEVVENEFGMRFIVHSEDDFATIAVELARVEERASKILIAALSEGEAPAPEGPDVPALGEAVPAGRAKIFAEFVEKIAVNWRGVLAENDDVLPFIHSNLLDLMNTPGAFRAVIAAYGRCRQAEKEHRAGN